MFTNLLVAISCLLLGCWLGHRAGGWRDRRAGALILLMAMGLLIAVRAARDYREVMFMPVLSWFTLGLAKWWSIAFAAPCLLFLLARWLRPSRLPSLVRAAAVLISLRAGVLTALGPLFHQEELQGLRTQIDRDGACLQSNDYLCGPAAAVTALRHLGIEAGERELASLFRTCRLTATQDDDLATTLAETYTSRGLRTRHGYFDHLADLKAAPVSIAVIRFSQNTDHFVTVFEVTDKEVVFGDPLVGLRRQSHAEFLEQWRHVAILIWRDEASSQRVSG